MPIKQSLWLLALGLVAISLPLRAQTPSRRAEIGVHYSSINLNVFDSTEGGGGIRFSYYLTNYLAVDAEGNIFDPRIGDYPTDDFLAAQGFVGVKAGIRRKRFGTFAKVRPGVANFPVLRVNRRFCSSRASSSAARPSASRAFTSALHASTSCLQASNAASSIRRSSVIAKSPLRSVAP